MHPCLKHVTARSCTYIYTLSTSSANFSKGKRTKMRNVEIKAKISNPEALVEKAKRLSKSDGVIMKQHDVFFLVSKGRLKLRKFENGTGELIYYERPDTKGPKLSSYSKVDLSAEGAEGVKEVLSQAYGILGSVEKTRQLFIVDQTRIHIDKVSNLGDFMELEVVLRDDQDIAIGQKISQDLMKQLEIAEEDTISVAYLDLLTIKE
ncbi:uncharacterized protein LOC105698407 [Orussus abietinus]|uniref:uncharacterized protein LOC105698407 n=1 Tax=Orussus abietinus TaxID=222816 RepID=UPI00062588CB|nr:uncharacterized protein LOC105698407 [Orussus abietinus]